MIIKNIDLINSVDVLKKISCFQLSVRTSFAIAKNIKLIDPALLLYGEEKQKLVNLYGEKDDKDQLKIDDKGQVNITDVEAFNKGLQELNDIEIELDIKPISIDALNCSLSAKDVSDIYFMLEE